MSLQNPLSQQNRVNPLSRGYQSNRVMQTLWLLTLRPDDQHETTDVPDEESRQLIRQSIRGLMRLIPLNHTIRRENLSNHTTLYCQPNRRILEIRVLDQHPLQQFHSSLPVQQLPHLPSTFSFLIPPEVEITAKIGILVAGIHVIYSDITVWGDRVELAAWHFCDVSELFEIRLETEVHCT